MLAVGEPVPDRYGHRDRPLDDLDRGEKADAARKQSCSSDGSSTRRPPKNTVTEWREQTRSAAARGPWDPLFVAGAGARESALVGGGVLVALGIASIRSSVCDGTFAMTLSTLIPPPRLMPDGSYLP
ncbi:hypothetical protein GCM10017744_009800 [Streptomyces antimycoticus]